jgi:serine/threonine protein phosphatase PrpC
VTDGAQPVEPDPPPGNRSDPEPPADAKFQPPTAVIGPATSVGTACPVDLTTPPIESSIPVNPAAVRLIDPQPPLTGAPSEPTGAGPEGPPAIVSDGEPANPGPTDPGRAAGPPDPVLSPWLIPSPADDRLAFSFNLAKIDGQGEDADPILHDSRDLGLLAVFDGMGGAGGTAYATDDGPRTGAYLASRAARDVVDRRMLDLLPSSDEVTGPGIAAELHDSIRDALRQVLAGLRAPRSRLRSKLLRALPTTMALAAVHRPEPGTDRWRCQVLWAGDSRVYLLRPDTGAAQLTLDDIRDRGDALANLTQDSVVSNAMSADTEFTVNHRCIELSTPFLLIAATDGCFGYLSTPMHFEGLLLSTMMNAPDQHGWSQDLQTQITAISGDDASMAVLGIGADHQGFRALFADRAAALEMRWVRPLDQLAAETREMEEHLEVLRRRRTQRTAELWAAYRPGYEQYLTVDEPGRSTR